MTLRAAIEMQAELDKMAVGRTSPVQANLGKEERTDPHFASCCFLVPVGGHLGLLLHSKYF